MSGGVWLLTTYPLWFDNGYATNVRATVLALCGGDEIEGVAAVVPARLATTRECIDWARAFEREFHVRVEVISAPPDLGVPVLRSISDKIICRRLRATMSRVDARLVHARGIRAGYLGSCALRIPLLVDVRGDVTAEASLEAAAHPSVRASRLVAASARETSASLSAAAGFVVVSDAMADWLRNSTEVGDRPVEVIPCPVNVEQFAVRESYELSESLVVAYVGGLQSYQSATLVTSALRAIAQASPVPIRAWVVTQSNHEELHDLLDSYGVTHAIEALGHDAIEARLCEADVGIVPRDSDQVSWVSCPTKIGEYLAAGVPALVGSGVGLWPRRLGDQHVGGPLGAGDDLDLGVPELLSEIHAERAAFAVRCRAVAEQDWSWTTAAPRMLELYKTLEARSGR